jgi:hypothetical protein
MSLGLAAVCVMGLGLAAPAMAHQFTASRLTKPLTEAEPGITKGKSIEGEFTGERNQRLRFGAFEVLCTATTNGKTVATGAVSWETSKTFTTNVKFGKCLTKAKFGGGFVSGLTTKVGYNEETKKVEPIKFVYHQNGFAEIGSGETSSEVEVGGASATVVIAGKTCKVNWPAQTIPVKAEKAPEAEYSSAVFSNTIAPVSISRAFPTGEQHRLIIANAFKGMAWNYESGQCVGEGGFEEEAKTTESKSALYDGNLEIQMSGGNLGFE